VKVPLKWDCDCESGGRGQQHQYSVCQEWIATTEAGGATQSPQPQNPQQQQSSSTSRSGFDLDRKSKAKVISHGLGASQTLPGEMTAGIQSGR